jgi:hypothetical protein
VSELLFEIPLLLTGSSSGSPAPSARSMLGTFQG